MQKKQAHKIIDTCRYVNKNSTISAHLGAIVTSTVLQQTVHTTTKPLIWDYTPGVKRSPITRVSSGN